ncbi:MAG: metal-dependent hydrolase [Acidobacteria bacterium]|nr:metal-dependent hydrolase [Acidobacteriota bacterium]
MSGIERRTFLKGSAAAATAPGALGAAREIIDTHVYLFRWPFRRLRDEETPRLVEMLRGKGAVQAWAGSFEGVFHKDLAAANARLAEECRRHGQGLLTPFGSVNPKLPDWEEDLRRCHEQLRMPGIRVHPGYHHYKLDDADFARLAEAAARRGLILQVEGWLEDERHHHPLMRVPTPDLAPLTGALARSPGLRVVVLNALRTATGAAKQLAGLRALTEVYFDFAMPDGLTDLNALIELVGRERVVFGSYAPMFYFESAELKIREAGLDETTAALIRAGNARRLMGPR